MVSMEAAAFFLSSSGLGLCFNLTDVKVDLGAGSLVVQDPSADKPRADGLILPPTASFNLGRPWYPSELSFAAAMTFTMLSPSADCWAILTECFIVFPLLIEALRLISVWNPSGLSLWGCLI